MRYKIIYADPPWRYADKSKHRGGAERHYDTMSTDDICALPIREIAEDDAALFIWGTWPHLSACERVVGAWGFTYKTCAFVWVKTNQAAEVNQSRMFPEEQFSAFWGMGHWTRSNTEFCLLATRGVMPPPKADRGVHQVVFSPILRHSEKPAEVRDRIVRLVGDVPRVELFARRAASGWDRWGNQVESTARVVRSSGPPPRR